MAASKNSVSFRVTNVKLRPNEEIVGFQLEVVSGGFEGVSSLPKGWRLAIDNRSATQTKLSADLAFGAERMQAKDMDGVVLTLSEFEGEVPRLSGHVVVTDSANERNVWLTAQNFIRL